MSFKVCGLVALIFFLCAGSLWGQQDAITPFTPNVPVNSTITTSPGKILAYAKQIARGDVGGSSAESVESALTRLFAISNTRISFGDAPPGDGDKVSGERQVYFHTDTSVAHVFLWYHSGVASDDWIELDMPPRIFMDWKAPRTEDAWRAWGQHGASVYWITTNQTGPPRSGTVYINNGVGAKDTSGVVIPNGAMGSSVMLPRGTLLRLTQTFTFTPVGGSATTVTSSSTVTIWRESLVRRDERGEWTQNKTVRFQQWRSGTSPRW